MDKTRVYNIAFVVHSTNENYDYDERLTLIRDFINNHKYQACEITHNKDPNTDTHTHFLIHNIDRYLEDIALVLNIENGFIENIRDYKAYYKYMLHDTKQAQADQKSLYNEKDFIYYNDFNIPSVSCSKYTLLDILNDIVDYDFKSVKDLVNFYISDSNNQKLCLVSRHFNLIKNYFYKGDK